MKFLVTHLRPEAGDLRLEEVEHIPKLQSDGKIIQSVCIFFLLFLQVPTVLMGDLNSLSSLDSAFYAKSDLAHVAASHAQDEKVTVF